jgi:tetratricopeptide (TPR) repeat protein
MSFADRLGYNFQVVKINQVIRGILIAVSILLLLVLMVSSDWTPLVRLISTSQSALDSGDLLIASISFAQAAQYSPEKYELLEKAGILAAEAGNTTAAKAYLVQVYDTQNLTPTGMNILGDVAYQQGNLDESIKFWEAANAGQEDAGIFIKLIQAYRQAGDWENTFQAQRELVALRPNNPDYNYQLGLMLAATQPQTALAYLSLAGELDESVKTVSKSLVRNLRSALNRGDPSYPFVIAGQEMASLGEWELAFLAFTNATELNPSYADAWAYRGEILQQLGQDGYKDLERALKLNPDSTAVNTLMGLYWQRQERYELALVYLYAAAYLEDDNPALQAEIGNTLGLMGNIPAAESHYQLAASFEPQKTTYWNTLANYYIRYEIEIKEKGAAAARQAVILAPEDPVSLDIMAQIYLLQDNPIMAERFLMRALSADEEYAPAHLHSGLVNIIEGDQLGAFQHFSAALSFSQPGTPTYDQARRLFETYFP